MLLLLTGSALILLSCYDLMSQLNRSPKNAFWFSFPLLFSTLFAITAVSSANDTVVPLFMGLLTILTYLTVLFATPMNPKLTMDDTLNSGTAVLVTISMGAMRLFDGPVTTLFGYSVGSETSVAIMLSLSVLLLLATLAASDSFTIKRVSDEYPTGPVEGSTDKDGGSTRTLGGVLTSAKFRFFSLALTTAFLVFSQVVIYFSAS